MKSDKLSLQLPRNVFPAIRVCSKMKTVTGNIFLSVFTSLAVVRLTLNREAVDEVREHWEGSSSSCWEQACSAEGGGGEAGRRSWEVKLGDRLTDCCCRVKLWLRLQQGELKCCCGDERSNWLWTRRSGRGKSPSLPGRKDNKQKQNRQANHHKFILLIQIYRL